LGLIQCSHHLDRRRPVLPLPSDCNALNSALADDSLLDAVRGGGEPCGGHAWRHPCDACAWRRARLMGIYSMFCDHLRRSIPAQVSYNRSEFDNAKLKAAVAWLASQPVEHFLVAFYNSRNNLIGIEELAKGGRHNVSFETEEVFRRCVVLSAKGFIAIHNHPEGGSKPSRQDITFTQRMIARGSVYNIHMLDSLIVDDQGGCNSLRQSKAIHPWFSSRPWAHVGPAIAKSMLDLERNLAKQPDNIRPLVGGTGLKLLLALYVDTTGKLVYDISAMTGLARSTVCRGLKGLISSNLVNIVDPAFSARHQRYHLSDEGFAVIESLLHGDCAARPELTLA
jgi:DNA-binding MarR family transcriptional regulator